MTNGEALGLQCSRAGPETFEREEESQGATSLRTGLLSMALHLHWGLCLVILGRALLVLGWHHCLLGERHRKIPPHLFFFFSPPRPPPQTWPEQKSCCLRATIQHHLLSRPLVCIPLPSDSWDGNDTPEDDFRGCPRKKVSSHLQIIRRRGSHRGQDSFSGLRNRAQVRHRTSCLPPHAVPTGQLCYCCRSLVSLT